MCEKSLNNFPQIVSIDLRYKNIAGLDWPCKPRPGPLAYNDSTHDLPEFDRYSRKNIYCILQKNFYF